MKGRIKDVFRRNIKASGLIFVLSVICLCFVLIHYSDDKLSDTNTVRGAVTDVKYHYVRGPWLTFNVGDVECFYMIADAGSEKKEAVIEKYEQLEHSGKTISVLTIDDWDFFSLKAFGSLVLLEKEGVAFLLLHITRIRK